MYITVHIGSISTEEKKITTIVEREILKNLLAWMKNILGFPANEGQTSLWKGENTFSTGYSSSDA